MSHFLRNLQASFAAHHDRAALLHADHCWSYAQLSAAAQRSAAWFQQMGVFPGDRVVLFTPNKVPFLIGNLAALWSGAIPLPLNPRLTSEEMRYFLTDSGARLILAGSEQQPLATNLAAAIDPPPLVALDTSVLNPAATGWQEPSIAATDPALILYSSGTTGWPKGVVHTHANIASSLSALAECWQMTPEDVVVNVLPLFHIHGLAFATYLTWLAGGTLLIDDAFDPRRTMNLVARSTVLMAVPPMYYRLLDEPGFADAAKSWDRTRLFTCGSAPIRPEVLPKLEDIVGRPIINRYGMTEAFVITSLPLDGPWPYGSVGRQLGGIDLQIVDDENRSLPPGAVGSVQIRGSNLFTQYWNKPAETAAALRNGWFDTGDLGKLDEHGFLTLVGRKHDLIIVSGYNVYPQVVERIIGECPGVAECAVFGIPDPRRGEAVAAAIVVKGDGLDEATIAAWCSQRLVHYQQPTRVLFLDSLPRNSLGKVLRRELCQRCQD